MFRAYLLSVLTNQTFFNMSLERYTAGLSDDHADQIQLWARYPSLP